MSDRCQDGVVQFFSQGAACPTQASSAEKCKVPFDLDQIHRVAMFQKKWHQILTLLTQQVSNKDFFFQGSIFRSYISFREAICRK